MIGLLFDNQRRDADIEINGDGSFATGDPMVTSAFVSLFTRAPAQSPDGTALPSVAQGWWANEYLQRLRGRPMGSRLWTLRRSKLEPTTLNYARIYSEEALGWWVRIGLARSVTVPVELRDPGISLTVVAIKKDGSRWDHQWVRRLADL